MIFQVARTYAQLKCVIMSLIVRHKEHEELCGVVDSQSNLTYIAMHGSRYKGS